MVSSSGIGPGEVGRSLRDARGGSGGRLECGGMQRRAVAKPRKTLEAPYKQVIYLRFTLDLKDLPWI